MNRIKMKNEKVILSQTGRSNVSRTKVWVEGRICAYILL